MGYSLDAHLFYGIRALDEDGDQIEGWDSLERRLANLSWDHGGEFDDIWAIMDKFPALDTRYIGHGEYDPVIYIMVKDSHKSAYYSADPISIVDLAVPIAWDAHLQEFIDAYPHIRWEGPTWFYGASYG